MILPSYLSGKERREKMAVMETAISSSLSHPNIVQTYTYAVEPVRANTKMRGAGVGAAAGAARDASLFGSSGATGVDGAAVADAAGPSGGDQHANVHSWEVRLVQEFCDRGSLRDALAAGLFRAAAASAALTPRTSGASSDLAGGAAAALASEGSGGFAAAIPEEATLTGGGLLGGGGAGGARGVNIEWVLCTALDVARAMAHLHKQSIVHSDLKARNVLLRSGSGNGPDGDSRHFTAKVCVGMFICVEGGWQRWDTFGTALPAGIARRLLAFKSWFQNTTQRNA